MTVQSTTSEARPGGVSVAFLRVFHHGKAWLRQPRQPPVGCDTEQVGPGVRRHIPRRLEHVVAYQRTSVARSAGTGQVGGQLGILSILGLIFDMQQN